MSLSVRVYRALCQGGNKTTVLLTRSLTSSTAMASLIPSADRVVGHDKNLWVEYSALAVKHGAVNLGQGFPDFSPPQFLLNALADCIKEAKYNQYTRGPGHPRLVNAIAKMFGKLLSREINPMTEVTTSIGAYSILYKSIQGHINPGDEVILIEPFFDCYQPMVEMVGGIPVYVPLRPSPTADKGGRRYPKTSKEWILDPEELSRAFTLKTKAIIINNPNNPIGKVFSRSELEMVGDLCKKHNVLCISDEVYEWLIYSGEQIRIASLPDMWERTITICSAGKTFSATGWKLGWAIAPPNLIANMVSITSNLNYTSPTPLQEAVAIGLETELARLGQPDSYFKQLPALLVEKRDRMAKVLEEVGLDPILPDGGYFMLADTTSLGMEFDPDGEPYDCQFVKWMMKEKKVAAIPPSFFFCPDHRFIADKLIRFCFCKEDSTLDAAFGILTKWAAEQKK